MSLNFLGLGSVVEGIGKVAGDLLTSDEERLKIALQEKAIDADLAKGQMEINKAEAQNPSTFVAGWRPLIGWIGGSALAYQFILYPIMLWFWTLFQAKGWISATLNAPPVLDAQQLWVMLTGMLGIAGLRSYDKFKGTQTSHVGK
jgi:hypothetical protein